MLSPPSTSPRLAKVLLRNAFWLRYNQFMNVLTVSTEAQLNDIRQLFTEYAASLNFNLDFQNFATELTNLPGEYAPPSGCLLLAIHENHAAGCVALHRLEEEICEMKRLYVRSQYRGLGVGKALAEAIIYRARECKYSIMRLDTVATMHEAQALYTSLGFVDIEPYCFNPLENARFMELHL